MLYAFVLLFFWPTSFGQHLTDEAIYTINGKKSLHTVSEKFVSFSIDPAVLLTGLNLSDTTVQMARRLAPAYVRIAGPSTQFVKYDEENSWNDVENGFVVVTPTMWFGINEWLASANLTPVFGINDGVAGREGWNPQEAMEVLDMADKFNVSCYWQLGYDCSNKTESQYVTDLKRLQHVLDAFPNKKNQWKIVGSDLRQCVSDSKKNLDDLSDVLTAVVLEPTTIDKNQLLTHLTDIYLKPKVPLWIASSKCTHPVSFASAIFWAKEMGEAAKNGYEVILKQPRLHEIYSETPPFWVSVLHKMLMGRNVLDAKATIGQSELSLYAHCTRHQNDFNRSGAMTVLAINNATSNHTFLLKFGSALLKSAEVQSYVLTAESEDATDVFLNGEKLSLDKIVDDKANFLPKLRRARIMNYLSLFLPPKSVGFFVLPGAQIPVCMGEDADLKLLMEEIKEDQNIPFSDNEISVEVTPRFALHRSPTLRELQEGMEKELESDERYYKQIKMKKKKGHDEVDGRNLFLHRMRHRQNEDKRLILGHDNVKHEEIKHVDLIHQPRKEEPKKIFELELTSEEIRRVLSDRAKAKAAKKNIIFTSEELEEIMDKATQKFLNNKNASIRIRKKSKREATRDKKDINMRLLKLKSFGDRRRLLKESLRNRKSKFNTPATERQKRDINMDLLKLKTELHTNNKYKKLKKTFENNEEKQATVRQPGQTSEEFVEFEEEEEEGVESPLPDGDVFAELAEPDDEFMVTTEKTKTSFKAKNLHNLHKLVAPRISVQPVKYEPKNPAGLESDFEVNSGPEDDDKSGNFDCIHEFFGKSKNEMKIINNNSSELWEVGFEPVSQTGKLPSITTRIKEAENAMKNQDTNLEGYFDEKMNDHLLMEDDYGDLESDESSPVRLKRDAEENHDKKDKVYYVLGQTYDSAKMKIDENLKDQQFKILKERLLHKKVFDFINKNNKLISKRKIRSLLGKTSYSDRYKSLTEGLKIWKPSDILTLKSPSKKKSKRSIDHDVDSVENEIGSFMNELMKDPKMIQPKLDMNHGDYQLVFPNSDKIQVVENKGDTEVKLVLHGEEEATCATTNKEESEHTTKSNIQKVSKKHMGDVWDKLVHKLSKFFHGLGNKLKKCIMEDLLSGV
ncbi:uncharacterized protein LOC135125895 [Zophobas morio]|uniref:uncharacterized protein LOC135125895 n=1 Tax=Zophobas morio TaxID=2755281 RepID=UPI0030833319